MSDYSLEDYELFFEELAAESDPALMADVAEADDLDYDAEKPCLTEEQVKALSQDMSENPPPQPDTDDLFNQY